MSPQAASPEPHPDGEAAPRDEPHTATLALWDIPDAAASGERFTFNVGVKSSAGCALSGGCVGIVDAAGVLLASGVLADAPWPGTEALYWTELAVSAPSAPGTLALSARFDAAEIEPPHVSASLPFTVTIVAQPEHRLTVRVIEQSSAAPVEDALVRLGPHRATTDRSGIATIKLPKGRLPLHVWKAGYEAPVSAVDMTGDAFVQIEVTATPEDDPDARWKA